MGLYKKGVEISANLGSVILYPLLGNTYVRTKSSLTRKRVLKGKEFEKTRQHAADLGRAAKIGSVIYKALPANIRERWLYRAITGEASSLLYKGKGAHLVKDFLWKKYIVETKVSEEAVFSPRGNNMEDSSKATNIQVRSVFQERWEKQGKDYYYFKRAWQKRGYFNRWTFREVLDHMGRRRKSN